MEKEAESALALRERLRKFGMRIENRNQSFALLDNAGRVLIAKGPTGAPATLTDIGRATMALCP